MNTTQLLNPKFGGISASRRLKKRLFQIILLRDTTQLGTGEVIRNRYQVIGKLGYGITSTVWLARDMEQRSYVTLKIFVDAASMGEHVDHELEMAIRSLVGSFNIAGSEDKPQCLVHPPLLEGVGDFLRRNPIQRLPAPVLAFTLHQLFSALDYCIHSVRLFILEQLQDPSPRKEADGRTIYLPRELKRQPGKLGAPVLCDFGSAPKYYRAAKVILEAPWSCIERLLIWNIFEGGSLFTGHDPESQTYRSSAHLAETINLLGPPPASLLAGEKRTQQFF
ncbi:hypothetical protein BDV10DRAFT_194874 [Aspergillus recurvatus]